MISISLIVTFISLFGSLLGFWVQILMAANYGTGVHVEAYLYSISTPIFLSGMTSAWYSYTIVPKISGELNNKIQNQFINTALAFSVSKSVILVAISPILISFQRDALPFNSEILVQKHLQQLFILGWLISGVQIVLSLMVAILTGLRRPIFATILNLGPYIGMLTFLLAAADKGIEYLAWGYLTGTTVSFTLALYSLRKRIFNRNDVAWSEIRSIVLNAPYTIIAMSCFSAYAVIDSYWAPRAGPGVLASLGYSQRIMIALGNIAVVGPSVVFTTKFSELIAKGNRKEFEKLFNRVLASVLAISCSLAILLYANGESIVSLVFTRGAFNQDDAERVAIALQYFLPGMVCMLMSVICLRILFCFKNIEKKAAFLGVIWITFYFTLSGMLIKISSKGIAIAYSITWIVCCIYIIIVILFSKREQLKTR